MSKQQNSIMAKKGWQKKDGKGIPPRLLSIGSRIHKDNTGNNTSDSQLGTDYRRICSC